MILRGFKKLEDKSNRHKKGSVVSNGHNRPVVVAHLAVWLPHVEDDAGRGGPAALGRSDEALCVAEGQAVDGKASVTC